LTIIAMPKDVSICSFQCPELSATINLDQGSPAPRPDLLRSLKWPNCTYCVVQNLIIPNSTKLVYRITRMPTRKHWKSKLLTFPHYSCRVQNHAPRKTVLIY